VENNESPELIEQRMRETRNALTEKVAMLEEQVVDTVHSATSAVQNTVETVKDTVDNVRTAMQETVCTVKDTVRQTFDVSSHVREHPWGMVGGAAAAGFLTGLFAFGRREESSSASGYRSYASAPPQSHAESYRSTPSTSSGPSWIDRLMERAGDELYKLGESALNQALTALQQSVHQNVPRLIEDVQNRYLFGGQVQGQGNGNEQGSRTNFG